MSTRQFIGRFSLGALLASSLFTASQAQQQPLGLEYVSTEKTSQPQMSANQADVPVKGLLYGSEAVFVELHGFLNFEGYNFQNQAEHPASSFDLHNWFFSAKVEPAKNWAVFGEIEYEHGTADIKLDRAFAEWSGLGAWATLRGGRFNSPTSFERNWYQAPVRLMVSRPNMSDVAFHEWSDTGVEAYGFPIPGRQWIQYDLAVVNGVRGLSEQGLPVSVTQDDRSDHRNKTVIGRLNFFPLQGLRAGSSYSTGKYFGGRGFKIVEFDSRYNVGRLDIWAEYMKRTGDDEPNPIPGNPFITGTLGGLQGWYVLAAYNVLQDQHHINYLKPIVRFDTVKNTSNGAGTNRTTIGLNYSPHKHILLKTEYQFLRQFNQPQLKSDGAMFALVVDF